MLTALDGLVDALPDGVLAVSADGTVLGAWGPNLALPAGRELLPGRRFDSLFSRPRAARQLLQAAATGGASRELRARDRRRLLLSAAPLAGGEGFAVSARPVAHSRRDEALGLLVREAIAGTDRLREPEDALRFLARLGRRTLPFDCLIAVVPQAQPGVLRVVAGTGRWGGRSVGQEWPVEARELRDDPGTRVIELRGPARLQDGRDSLGVVAFHGDVADAGEEELGIMADFAALVAASIERAELRQAAERSAARLQTALDIAIDLAASLEPKEVVKRLLMRAGDMVAADRGTLIRVLGDDLVVEDSFDRQRQAAPAGDHGSLSKLPADSLVRLAFESRRAAVGEGYSLPELPAPFQEAVADVTRRLAFPLVLGGDVVAVLSLHRRRGPGFSREDVETLQLLGSVAALALRNAWLFSEAQEVARAKTDFLNMGAHELRTPLTVIVGYLSMLKEGAFGPPPDGWRHPLDMLEAKSAELTALVEDLLLASRMETGRLPYRRSRFDLRRTVEAAVGRASVRAEMSGAKLECRLPPKPVQVEADPEDVGRALDALIANAIVYSDQTADVTVTLTAEPAPRVTVEDRGEGVPEHARERIFERFYRVDDPLFRHRAGTGLGLYIGRELARRHGGDVVLEWTRRGEGSRFVLELPRP